jgi:hypothetical protein
MAVITGMNRFQTAPLLVAGALIVIAAPPAFGQVTNRLQAPGPVNAPAAPSPAQPPVVVYQNPDRLQNANEVQNELRQILQAYPPSLRQLLAIDPSLTQREDYMAPYPALSAFLQQHPEIIRNPSYFFGSPNFDRGYTEGDRRIEVLRNTLEGITFLTGFLTVISLLYALLRQALEYRRWRRQIQIQTDIHTKLLDRMTNNQELLAYIETSAGRRFLEAPVPLMAQAPASSIAPVARILWSVQIGVIVVAAGIGFWIARTTVSDPDLISVFQVMGSLAMAVGVGFVVSALMSWALSQRMGLLAAPAAKAEQ